MRTSKHVLNTFEARRFHLFGFYYLIILIFPACDFGVPHAPSHVIISTPPIFRPESADDVKNAEQAVRAIISIARESSVLPVVTPVHLYIYKNKASMAFYGKGWNTLPIDIESVAFVRGSEIHVNSEILPQSGFGITNTLAHEYGHVVANQISTNKRFVPKWFKEGFAAWAGAKILELLNWQDLDILERKIQAELFVNQNEIPRFDSSTAEHFWRYNRSKPKGALGTYGVAFVAVSKLLKTHGIDVAVRYMRTGEFTNSFGYSEEVFASQVDGSIRSSSHQQSHKKNYLIPKPTWRLGDQWAYIAKRSGQPKTTIVRQITKESRLNGVPTFVVEFLNAEIHYSKETLGAVGAMKNGKLIFAYDKPDQQMLWPLEVGKSWQNVYSVRNVIQNSSAMIKRFMSVVGEDVITVPAGTFDVLKVESFNSDSGRLIAEYWYSPAIKWFAKTRTYTMEDGINEEELARFASR